MTALLAGIKVQPRKFPLRQGEIEKSILGNAKATKELGWYASRSLKDGLKETISSYQTNT